jgi:hypothetical protein
MITIKGAWSFFTFVFPLIVWFDCASSFVVRFESSSRYSTTTTQQLSMTSRREDSVMSIDAMDAVDAAPMYITVGPQCCGKTTLLKQIDPNLVDISLDDQPGVYVPVPTQYLVAEKINTTNVTAEDSLLLQLYQGKTLVERIQNDNTELRLILQRWSGQLSPQTFAVHVLQHYQERNAADIAQTLIATVEDFLSESPPLPATTQVFILESLFRRHPTLKQSAIERAHELLRTTPSHIPIAWGNTNAKPRDYQQALEIASQTRRPVEFLVCHPDGTGKLPWLPLETLLLRNLHRLARTGKYVPAFAISDCCQRLEHMNIPTNNNATQMEQALVQMASPQPRGGPSPYQYQLTNQRLIQKKYPSRSNDNRRNDRNASRGNSNNNRNQNGNTNGYRYDNRNSGNDNRNVGRNGNGYQRTNENGNEYRQGQERDDAQRKRQLSPTSQQPNRPTHRPRWNNDDDDNRSQGNYRPQNDQQYPDSSNNNSTRRPRGDWQGERPRHPPR